MLSLIIYSLFFFKNKEQNLLNLNQSKIYQKEINIYKNKIIEKKDFISPNNIDTKTIENELKKEFNNYFLKNTKYVSKLIEELEYREYNIKEKEFEFYKKMIKSIVNLKKDLYYLNKKNNEIKWKIKIRKNKINLVFIDKRNKNKKKYILNRFTVSKINKLNIANNVIKKYYVYIKNKYMYIHMKERIPIYIEYNNQLNLNIIKEKIINILETIEDIEYSYNLKNKIQNYNYIGQKYIEIFNNSICKLKYEFKNNRWILLEMKMNKDCKKNKHIINKENINISRDLINNKVISYLFYNSQLNKYQNSKIKKNNINKIEKLLINKDIVYVYQLKNKYSYNKYSILPLYTKIVLKEDYPFFLETYSLLKTKKIKDRYYVFLIKQLKDLKKYKTQLKFLN